MGLLRLRSLTHCGCDTPKRWIPRTMSERNPKRLSCQPPLWTDRLLTKKTRPMVGRLGCVGTISQSLSRHSMPTGGAMKPSTFALKSLSRRLGRKREHPRSCSTQFLRRIGNHLDSKMIENGWVLSEREWAAKLFCVVYVSVLRSRP